MKANRFIALAAALCLSAAPISAVYAQPPANKGKPSAPAQKGKENPPAKKPENPGKPANAGKPDDAEAKKPAAAPERGRAGMSKEERDALKEKFRSDRESRKAAVEELKARVKADRGSAADGTRTKLGQEIAAIQSARSDGEGPKGRAGKLRAAMGNADAESAALADEVENLVAENDIPAAEQQLLAESLTNLSMAKEVTPNQATALAAEVEERLRNNGRVPPETAARVSEKISAFAGKKR